MYVPRLLEEHGLGEYERYGLDCWLAMVELAPPGAVFDIGSNVGVYGHLAAAYSDRDVHLFEPTPGAVEVARAAILREGARFTVVQTALGEESGTARLYLSDRTDSSNSLNASFRPHTRHLDVSVQRLDDYVARTGVVPAVLKVDTETTEPEVLAGSSELIRAHRPWLLIEVLAGRVEVRLEEVLRPHGYTYYHLDGPGRRPPRDRFSGDPTYRHLMYLALPHPAPDHLWHRMASWRETLATSAVVSTLS
jgi:FkbM family methyltransferase